MSNILSLFFSLMFLSGFSERNELINYCNVPNPIILKRWREFWDILVRKCVKIEDKIWLKPGFWLDSTPFSRLDSILDSTRLHFPDSTRLSFSDSTRLLTRLECKKPIESEPWLKLIEILINLEISDLYSLIYLNILFIFSQKKLR